MTKKQVTIITVLTVAALILGLLISRRLWFRLDLTKNKAYTISAVSRNLYTEIPDQVRITYYISEKLSAIHPLPGEITDLLREYAAYSRGKIRFTVRDPAKAGLVQAVEQLGIQPQQIQTVEQDQASVATVYTGMVIEYLDELEVLPVVFSLDTLEYDLTSRIRSLVRGTERDVGVIVGDSYKEWTRDYPYVNQAFGQSGFNVRLINPGDEIPDTLPALFVLGGTEDLDTWALYRMDRYIQGGGKVLFALEGVYVNTQGSFEARVMTDKGLLAMVSFYGATVKPELVLDKAALMIQYQTTGPSGGRQIRMARYSHWIGILEERGNRNHPVTARFGGVDLFWPSPIELNPPESISAEPLFTSSPEAWLQTRDFATNPDITYLFEREAPDTKGVKILGAALSGKFPSWFADVPKPTREGVTDALPDLPAETTPSRIIVIGDTDMASTFMQYTRGQRNLDFLLQAVGWLGNDDDIIGIRNRQIQAGRLDKIIDQEKRGRAMMLSRIINVVFVPLGVIILGIFLTWKRRTRAALRRKQKS
ncbi:MAG: GldG family protein [Treponema sp.]|jgi:gliding-associated putative ABC transporter substrate-binding component GldG|nr:GldG family protein [Treponema sp.]